MDIAYATVHKGKYKGNYTVYFARYVAKEIYSA